MGLTQQRKVSPTKQPNGRDDGPQSSELLGMIDDQKDRRCFGLAVARSTAVDHSDRLQSSSTSQASHLFWSCDRAALLWLVTVVWFLRPAWQRCKRLFDL